MSGEWSRIPAVFEKKEAQMLVLSRKKNERIVINDDITIIVLDIRGNRVRLGVEAPEEVPVHRREVFDAIHRNEMALHQPPNEVKEEKPTSGGPLQTTDQPSTREAKPPIVEEKDEPPDVLDGEGWRTSAFL
jgi:carbon storage regulator